MYVVCVEFFFSTQMILWIFFYKWKELNGEYKILPCKWSALIDNCQKKERKKKKVLLKHLLHNIIWLA